MSFTYLVYLAQAHHAWNACDGHGGRFKPVLKKLAVQNIEVDMARMKQAVEAACRNTTVTVLSIEHDVLDAKFFAAGEPKASRLVI
jgi:hypothetical protein